jgi:hypothetical protein
MKTIPEAIAALPKTEPELVALLRGQGCCGLKGAARGCPVHQWFLQETGEQVAIFGDELSDQNSVYHPLPAVVNDFVQNFDGGVYQDLVIAVEFPETPG